MDKRIEQVAATMAIEGMPLSEQCYKDLQDIIDGKKTVEESIQESIERYTQH